MSVAIVGVSLISPVLAISPKWATRFDSMVAGFSAGDFGEVSSSRVELLNKAWALISDNPILGVGVAGSRSAYYSDGELFGTGLLHNSFLTEWADKGILGLVAYIVWLALYLKIASSVFWRVSSMDRLWLLLYIPLVLAFTFKDFPSVNGIFLAVLSGIYYQQLVGRRQPDGLVGRAAQ